MPLIKLGGLALLVLVVATAVAVLHPGEGSAQVPPSPTPIATSSPNATATPTATQAPVASIGGRGFGITLGSPAGNCSPASCISVHLSWQGGAVQTGYVVARLQLPSGVLTTLPTGGPLGPAATSFTDTAPPSGLDCYTLLPQGSNPQAVSDLLCTIIGTQSPSAFPRDLTLRLNQTSTASLSWQPPAGGGHDSYALVTPGGTQSLPASQTSIAVPMSGFGCFAVGAMQGATLLGTSGVVCALPGFANFGPPLAGSPTATSNATLTPTVTISTPTPTTTVAAATVTSTSTRTATSTPPTDCPQVGPLPFGPRMYVGLKGINCIAIYDSTTNVELGRIPVAGGPDALTLNRFGTRLYATNTAGNVVIVIDTFTNTQVASIPLGTGPYGIAVNVTSNRVYTANPTQLSCAGASGTVSVIDATTNTLITNVTTVISPLGVAVNPDGSRVYVGGGCQDIGVLDTTTNTVLPTLDTGPIGFGVGKLAVGTDGSRLYVPIYGISGTNGTEVQVFDTATGSRVSTIPVGLRPFSVTVDPNRPRVYVTNVISNSVSVIDTITNTVVATIGVGAGPYASAVNQVGTRLYVSNEGAGTISIVDIATNAVVGTIVAGVGTQPLDIAMTPLSG